MMELGKSGKPVWKNFFQIKQHHPRMERNGKGKKKRSGQGES